jgi:hypothetical protein
LLAIRLASSIVSKAAVLASLSSLAYFYARENGGGKAPVGHHVS